MKKEWIKIIPQIANHLDEVEQLKCPNCGKHEIDYIYIYVGIKKRESVFYKFGVINV